MATENPSPGEMMRRVGFGAGLAIGMGVGVALGVAFDNMALGIGLGVGIGTVFMIVFATVASRFDRRGGDDPDAGGPASSPDSPDRG